MKQNYYYADFDWNVDIDDGKSGVLEDFTAGEIQGLQLSIWHAISNFMSYRALKLMDLIEDKEKPESEKDTIDLPADGG